VIGVFLKNALRMPTTVHLVVCGEYERVGSNYPQQKSRSGLKMPFKLSQTFGYIGKTLSKIIFLAGH